jgi:hypothetical protein
MGFFDIAKKVAKGAVDVAGVVADKAAEMKAKAERRQQEVMVNKSDSELKRITSKGGIDGMAARMELKDRGLA